MLVAASVFVLSNPSNSATLGRQWLRGWMRLLEWQSVLMPSELYFLIGVCQNEIIEGEIVRAKSSGDWRASHWQQLQDVVSGETSTLELAFVVKMGAVAQTSAVLVRGEHFNDIRRCSFALPGY